MRDPALRLTSLAKMVPGGRQLFRELALALEAGERVAIRGEPGAGKSTLLNIIAGLDTADSGEVIVAGTDLTRLSEAGRTALRRDAIGFVFQAFHILPHLDLALSAGLGGGFLVDPVPPSAVHLCVDMQRIFSSDGPWPTPWMERVLPTVTRIAERFPESTVFNPLLSANPRARPRLDR
jgi:hypothetical protein